MREALEAVQAKQADDHQNLIDLAIVASLLITLLLVWLLQEKRHSSKLVLAHKDTENAVVAQSLMQSFAYLFKYLSWVVELALAYSLPMAKMRKPY
jgi:NADH:ubiquinone oxidoreductase subunit 6 (subunit J)